MIVSFIFHRFKLFSLGEMMIYGSFASMVLRHPSWWFPWACLAIIWSLSHFDIFRVEIIEALNNLHASHVK